ncbi:MAG TPA: polysaccharide deacetylase family protein [Kofleriaceae bacterium]
MWFGIAAWAGLPACAHQLVDDDNVYYQGVDQPRVLCASSIDDRYTVGAGELDDALSRAHADGSTVHLYAHDPGRTIALSEVESVISLAASHGMDFVTYAALGTGGAHGSLALSFDDNSVADWTAMRPLLAKYGAKVTFFVTRYLVMTDDEHQQLHDLEADGHDVEFHTVAHLEAVTYVTAHGLDAYLADEILPGLAAMQADGYTITSFAYPFGQRDAELDAALTPYFEHIRAIESTCPRGR